MLSILYNDRVVTVAAYRKTPFAEKFLEVFKLARDRNEHGDHCENKVEICKNIG